MLTIHLLHLLLSLITVRTLANSTTTPPLIGSNVHDVDVDHDHDPQPHSTEHPPGSNVHSVDHDHDPQPHFTKHPPTTTNCSTTNPNKPTANTTAPPCCTLTIHADPPVATTPSPDEEGAPEAVPGWDAREVEPVAEERCGARGDR